MTSSPNGFYLEVVVPVAPQSRGHGYGLIRTYRVQEFWGGELSWFAVVQINIHRDAYDRQSLYLASVLTDRGWQEVHRILPESPDMTGLPDYAAWKNAKLREGCVTAVEAVADRLVRETCLILRPQRHEIAYRPPGEQP